MNPELARMLAIFWIASATPGSRKDIAGSSTATARPFTLSATDVAMLFPCSQQIVALSGDSFPHRDRSYVLLARFAPRRGRDRHAQGRCMAEI
jgi:hypothetical protein